MLRKIPVSQLENQLYKLIIKATYDLPKNTLKSISASLKNETKPLAKQILREILDNARIAKQKKMPLCQDTGLALILIEIGQDVHITGGDLEKSLQQTVAKAYKDLYLRKSVVNDPLQRKNTGTNTPAMIYTHIVPGSKIKITFLPKGGGSENCSALRMLKPSDGLPGVEKFILDTVRSAEANPCPPIIVGVGLGGNFDMAAYLAKKAIIRPLGKKNPKTQYQELENNLLAKINELGIGPMGLGGKTTALAVHIETLPCHIAALPVAVNIQCHSNRAASVTI